MALDCDLVIPCRDEAAALPAVLALVPVGMRVIVVDNGSRDGTAEVARRLGATVVDESRPGYGAAVHAGMEAASAQYVAVLDGDGSMDPRELLPLLEEVRSGRATMACGRRRPATRRTPHRCRPCPGPTRPRTPHPCARRPARARTATGRRPRRG